MDQPRSLLFAEPASLALLGLGVLALGSQIRRQKRSRCAH